MKRAQKRGRVRSNGSLVRQVLMQSFHENIAVIADEEWAELMRDEEFRRHMRRAIQEIWLGMSQVARKLQKSNGS